MGILKSPQNRSTIGAEVGFTVPISEAFSDAKMHHEKELNASLVGRGKEYPIKMILSAKLGRLRRGAKGAANRIDG